MIKVYSQALDKYISIERQFINIEGATDGPTMIIVSGIHGNESSGIFALQRLQERISNKDLKGNIVAFAGNMKALQEKERYIDEDLNRIWTKELLASRKSGSSSAEYDEQIELIESIEKVLSKSKGPVTIIDLHTTSSNTAPFLTLNNDSATLEFCKNFPIPKITKIDNYVKGAFFTYMNQLGHIALGFEAGQHDALATIDEHEKFVCLALSLSGMYSFEKTHYNSNDAHTYEIKERFEIIPEGKFKMKSGYSNFQEIEKGETLATYFGKSIVSSASGRVFLPLYQKKGEDGFFIIQSIME